MWSWISGGSLGLVDIVMQASVLVDDDVDISAGNTARKTPIRDTELTADMMSRSDAFGLIDLCCDVGGFIPPTRNLWFQWNDPLRGKRGATQVFPCLNVNI